MQTGRSKKNTCDKTQKSIVLNDKIRDSSSKIIFDDSILCAQFMNDYVDGLEDITVYPENIEDVSERYVPLIAEERNSDCVKRIKIPNKTPFYFISLIEHKTEVDYNVGMQIFRYIYQIWEDYEKEMESEYAGISKTKGFCYPPVIPIVYYEGKAKWTAPIEFKEKVAMREIFGDMIPNFTYQLVCLNDYSNEELLDKGDAISLMMLINKIKTQGDVEQFMKISSERLAAIVKPLPEHLVKKIAQIFRVWLYAMNTPENEVEEIVSRVEEKDMARLFEGMEVDIQAERKKLHKERQELAEEKQELAEEKQKVAQEKQQLAKQQQQLLEMSDTMIRSFIENARSEGKTKEQILSQLQSIFMLSEEDAIERLKKLAISAKKC